MPITMQVNLQFPELSGPTYVFCHSFPDEYKLGILYLFIMKTSK